MTKIPFSSLFLSVFGLGFSRMMPGTVTSIFTTIVCFNFVYFLSRIYNPFLALYLNTFLLLLLTIISFLSIKRFVTAPHDRSFITIDEFIGQLITLTPLIFLKTTSIWPYLTGLILFRILDIKKPLFIKTIDNQGTPFSVIFDDIVAGIISSLLLLIILTIFPTW